MSKVKRIREKIPFPKNPPTETEDLRNAQWGHVIFYSDGTCEYVDERPSNKQILDAINDLAINQEE
ncbi:hypothetical protein [Marinicella sp. W31]|uniref:hypothetical protein n=1 Tax=Marinicella sp. W31 TaxID=3023713 RepID=UPI003756735F